MKTVVKTAIILFVMAGTTDVSAQFTQRNARDFINKTSYIIGEAYDVVYYYGYYSSGYLSKAVNHQNYAKYLYNIANYRYAVYHSDLARSYALRVIYNSTNYWDNYYRPYYYSPPRSPYVNNRPPQSTYNYSYSQNVQYGHRSGTSVSSVNRANNSRVSKYSSTGNNVKSMDFNAWDRNYYSSQETSLLRGVSMPSERELESAVAGSSNIRRVSDDKTVINNGIRNFSSDIDTYRKSNAEEARSISISRPSDFGTTPEVTRSTANTVSPTANRQSDSRSTETRQTTTQPSQTRQTTTQSSQTTQPVQSRQTTTQPVQTRQQTQPAQTRQQQTATPTNTRTSSESTQPSRNTSTTNQQQATPQRNSTPATNQNTNNSTQRR